MKGSLGTPSQEGGAQSLQFPRIAVQGKQTQKGDDVPEDRNMERRILRDKQETKNGSRKHEAHAGDEQYEVAQQRVPELRR